MGYLSLRGGYPSCPWGEVNHALFHLQKVRCVQVLRTHDRLVRPNRPFSHSLLVRRVEKAAEGHRRLRASRKPPLSDCPRNYWDGIRPEWRASLGEGLVTARG